MKLSAYLSSSRHGIYYFRWSLPRLEGNHRKTIRISLRTRCQNRAGDLARYLASCGRLISGNLDLAKLRQDEIREMVRNYFQTSLNKYAARLDGVGISKNALEDMRHEIELHEDFLGFETKNPQYLPVANFRREIDISDNDWTENEFALINEMRKARRDSLKSILKTAEQRDMYFSNSDTPERKTPLKDEYGLLGNAVTAFMDEHSRQWSDGMTQKAKSYLDVLLEFFTPEKKIAEINRQDANTLKQALLELPKNRKTKPQTKDLTLREAIALKDVSKIGAKTVNSHIDTFHRFFVWAERNGYAPEKLFDGIKVANAKATEEKRMPFSENEIATIYAELTENRSGHVNKPHHKWGALIGLYTGARLNEIAQLQVSDIKQDKNIWYFHINDEGTKQSVKSYAAIRKVPIHSELIRLGFLDYLKAQNPHGRLFPDLRYNKKNGYGRNIGRWFNEFFLVTLGIKKPSNSFHSFRHTMITRLAQTGIEQSLIQQIVGHEREGVTQQVYMKEGYTLQQMNEAIEKFKIIGIIYT